MWPGFVKELWTWGAIGRVLHRWRAAEFAGLILSGFVGWAEALVVAKLRLDLGLVG